MSLEQLVTLISLISTIVAIIAGIFGLFRFFEEQRKDRQVRIEDLQWRRAQFLFELAQNFNKDETIQRAYRLIENGSGLPKQSSLDQILTRNISTLTERELELRFAIDRYLGFFEQLYEFTVENNVLAASDIVGFSWYVHKLATHNAIRTFAEQEGYSSVMRLDELLVEYINRLE